MSQQQVCTNCTSYARAMHEHLGASVCNPPQRGLHTCTHSLPDIGVELVRAV